MYNMTHLINNGYPTEKQVKYERRHRRFDPTCPVCQILEPLVPGTRPLDECCAVLLRAAKVPCRCLETRHCPLAKHPHTPAGCRGFA